MPQVSINIANRTYEFACGEGEEQRVHELASYVDGKVTELRATLRSGRWKLWCSLPGHAKAGMVATLTVHS